MNKYKNKTEEWMANYLKQEETAFDYEPFPDGQKNPDFQISTDHGTVLIESEEVNFLQTDTIHAPERGVRVFSFDPTRDWEKLRNTIKHASRQLEPYASTHDYRIIILGKPSGFEIKINDLFSAMVGDERMVMDFDPKLGRAKNPRWEPAVNGAMRKNNANGDMVLHKKYISAIGLIKEFNGYNWYYRQTWDNLRRSDDNPRPNESMDEAVARGLKFSEKVEDYINGNGIPERFQDRERMFYRLEMIVNPIATKPMPGGLFRGEWDKVVKPEIEFV